MIKVGDNVRVDGKEARVIGSWGQGKHMAWSLDDGRVILDLHKLVEAGTAEVLLKAQVRQKPLTNLPVMDHLFESLPKEDEDFEE